MLLNLKRKLHGFKARTIRCRIATEPVIKKMCGALRDLVPFVQFKKHEKYHGGVLILVKLQASACKFTKINAPPWVFFTFFKLYKWYQIAQRATCMKLCALQTMTH